MLAIIGLPIFCVLGLSSYYFILFKPKSNFYADAANFHYASCDKIEAKMKRDSENALERARLGLESGKSQMMVNGDVVDIIGPLSSRLTQNQQLSDWQTRDQVESNAIQSMQRAHAQTIRENEEANADVSIEILGLEGQEHNYFQHDALSGNARKIHEKNRAYIGKTDYSRRAELNIAETYQLKDDFSGTARIATKAAANEIQGDMNRGLARLGEKPSQPLNIY